MIIKGKIITFVGLDGSGKSTQIEMLHEYLKNRGAKSVVSLMKQFVRLSNKELLEFLHENKLRIHNPTELEIIRSALAMKNKVLYELMDYVEQGVNVITDRYLETNFIFAKQLNAKCEVISMICNSVMDLPDIQFFIDVPPEICYKRIINRNENIKPHETLENLNIAYEYYQNRVLEKFYVPINGNQPVEKVHFDIRNRILDLID